jgi:GDP-4-dehydro-6-deoxy-D-mannose reductase
LEKGEPGEVYQLCSGRAVAIEFVLHTLMRLTPKPIRVQVDESKVRGQEAPVLWGDLTKARQAVGWTPEIDLKTTLRGLALYGGQIIRSQSNLMPPTTS